MTSVDRWLLPDGVEEVLPNEAHKLETLRRRILDGFQSWGYQLVITPLIEYLDSLLVGSSHDLDLQTFKITDQLSGRMMGIRADITPQVARIDAHNLNRQGPVRLCYADTVLHTRSRGLQSSRIPIRIGAEMFGSADQACDVELICLMMEMLRLAEINGGVHLILGHVGIFRGLVREAGIGADIEAQLFDIMQRKAFRDLELLLQQEVADAGLRNMLQMLARLSGGDAVLEQAAQCFAEAPVAVRNALAELEGIHRRVSQRLPGVSIGFDLSELRGYQYHTGVVFASYRQGYGRALAKGGRFDDIGRVFGRARPASGFDADLKVLARLSGCEVKRAAAVLAPDSDDPALWQVVTTLRSQGETVISAMAGMDPALAQAELDCDRQLVKTATGWQVKALA